MVEKGSDHMKSGGEIYKLAQNYLNEQKRRCDQQQTEKKGDESRIGIWEESLMNHVLKVRNEEEKRRGKMDKKSR